MQVDAQQARRSASSTVFHSLSPSAGRVAQTSFVMSAGGPAFIPNGGIDAPPSGNRLWAGGGVLGFGGASVPNPLGGYHWTEYRTLPLTTCILLRTRPIRSWAADVFRLRTSLRLLRVVRGSLNRQRVYSGTHHIEPAR